LLACLSQGGCTRLKPIAQQVVVIMGASSGIWRATALRFAKRGAKLVVSARSGPGLRALTTSPETTHAHHSRLGNDVERVEAVREGRTHGTQAVERGRASRPAGAARRSHRRCELARRQRVRRGITNTAIRKEGARRMAEEMAADGPDVGLTEQMKDALYQVYQQFLAAYPGEVSPATATHGVLAAAVHILITVHSQASPDEEALVSWERYKNTCLAELDRMMSEPQAAGGGDAR
jgi:NAD(P)-dependent dehydrogenase (short-subunit alcohol dehydrogenase family)